MNTKHSAGGALKYNPRLVFQQCVELEEESHDSGKPNLSKEEERKVYNLGVLKQVQAIFGHLACSKLQYYIPRGFWKQFRLQSLFASCLYSEI